MSITAVVRQSWWLQAAPYQASLYIDTPRPQASHSIEKEQENATCCYWKYGTPVKELFCEHISPRVQRYPVPNTSWPFWM